MNDYKEKIDILLKNIGFSKIESYYRIVYKLKNYTIDISLYIPVDEPDISPLYICQDTFYIYQSSSNIIDLNDYNYIINLFKSEIRKYKIRMLNE